MIGVNTAIYSPSGTNAGLAFSIPSNLVKQVAEQLREFGKVRRGWIGVSYQSVTDDIADSFGLDRARGVLVANVTADGPAAKAGVKRNDIILTFAGQEVPDLRRFPRIVANARVGSTVDIMVWRGGKEVPLKLRIGEQEEPEKQNASAQGRRKKPAEPDQAVTSTIEQLGLTLAEGDRPAAREVRPVGQRQGRGRHQGGAQQPGGREAAPGGRRHPRGRPEAGDHAAGGHRNRRPSCRRRRSARSCCSSNARATRASRRSG